MYPASRSNAITYAYFCQLGGLSNSCVQRVTRRNGSYVYYTYHLIDRP